MVWRNFRDPDYIKWRKAVYVRDGYQCKFPGCLSKKKIEAHHIQKWSSFVELRFVVSNGIVLCKDHHILVTGHENDYVGLFTMIVAQAKRKETSADPFALDKFLNERKKKNGKKNRE